jgi:hypothetical protein
MYTTFSLSIHQLLCFRVGPVLHLPVTPPGCHQTLLAHAFYTCFLQMDISGYSWGDMGLWGDVKPEIK